MSKASVMLRICIIYVENKYKEHVKSCCNL